MACDINELYGSLTFNKDNKVRTVGGNGAIGTLVHVIHDCAVTTHPQGRFRVVWFLVGYDRHSIVLEDALVQVGAHLVMALGVLGTT
eukprot:1873798-Ditylum_brightwellii.AAC.1